VDRARGGATLAPPWFVPVMAGGLAGSLGIASGSLCPLAAVAAPGSLHVEIRQRFVAPSGFVWWRVQLTNAATAPVTIIDLAMQADSRRTAATPAGRTLPAFLERGGVLGPGEVVEGPVSFGALGAATEPEGRLAIRYRDDAGTLHHVELPLRVGASSEAAP
jgi:hypothetical protein